MPTEGVRETELRIDTLKSEEELLSQVEDFEQRELEVVNLKASFESVGRLRPMMLALRASNISALLTVEPPTEKPGREEVRALLAQLRDWDQLLLQSLLNLCRFWIPEKYHEALETEARIEVKWFREWIGASRDPRMAPGLPWRSFIRKTVSENYQFADSLMETVEFSPKELPEVVSDFLKQKKQAVCIFPKRWRRQSEATH